MSEWIDIDEFLRSFGWRFRLGCWWEHRKLRWRLRRAGSASVSPEVKP